jgi:MFS family permease
MRGASYPKLTACVACIAVLSMGGVIFGIAGLYPALYIRGFWEGMCDTAMCDLRGDLNRGMSVPYEQLSRFTTSLLQVFTEMPPGVVPEACCSSQVLMVGVVTSFAFAITDGSSAVWGELNDRLGPKWGISVAVGLVVLSQLLLVLSSGSALRINDGLATAAFFGIGAGGAGVTTAAFVGCTLAVAASSSDMQAYLSTGLAATFDISAIIFPLVSELHQMGVSLPIIVAFVWLPLSAISGGWLIWLFSEPAPPPKQTGVTPKEGSALLDGDKAADPPSTEVQPKCMEKGGQASTLLSAHNLLLLAFMCAFTMATTFHVSVYGLESRLRFGEAKAAKFENVFSIGFPLSSLLAAVFCIPLLRNTTDRPHIYWAVAVGVSCVWAIFTLIPLAAAQYFAAVLFGVARTAVWSAYYHFLSSPAYYPPDMIGRVLGCNTLVVAFMGDLLSHLVERVAVRTPAEVPPIIGCRVWLLLQLVLAAAFPLFLLRSWYQSNVAR